MVYSSPLSFNNKPQKELHGSLWVDLRDSRASDFRALASTIKVRGVPLVLQLAVFESLVVEVRGLVWNLRFGVGLGFGI